MTFVIKYALDSDVLMQAARNFYAFDIAPGFWNALIHHGEEGSIVSIDRVKAEVDRGNDELKDWANNDFHQSFESTNQDDVIEAYRRVMNWAYAEPRFTDAAKSEFARETNADAWIVSYAIAFNENNAETKIFVVTQEKFEPNIIAKIKIPNVCRVFDIKSVDLYQMLRALKVKLLT